MLTSFKQQFFFIFIIFFMSSCISKSGQDFLQAESHINADNMAEYIEVLASDEFMGRMPFTKGEELSIQYLKEKFIELGLEPAINGSYFQEVALMEVAVKLVRCFSLC